jgi:hypothetical protein
VAIFQELGCTSFPSFHGVSWWLIGVLSFEGGENPASLGQVNPKIQFWKKDF